LHRAIAWSDVYYGDGSSLIPMYQAVSKPILIQNTDIINSEPKADEIVLQFENLCYDGQYFWFTEYWFNALFRMDKNTWTAEFMGVFPDEKFLCERLFSSVTECNSILYFAPLSANEIAAYNTKTGEFLKIPFPSSARAKHRFYYQYKLIKAVTVGDCVFFIPYLFPGILCYDTNTQTLTNYDDWIENVENLRTSVDGGYFYDCIIDGSRLVLPCVCSDAIVLFDTNTRTSEVWRNPSSEYAYKYYGVCYDGDSYYFISADGTVIKRKMHSQAESTIKLKLPVINNINLESDILTFSPARFTDGSIWLFPYKKNTALKIKAASGEVAVADVFNDESEYDGMLYSFLFAEVIDGHIYAMTGRSSRFIEYDPGTDSKIEGYITAAKEDYVQITELLSKCFFGRFDNEYFFENNAFTVGRMIDGSSHIRTVKKDSEDSDDSALSGNIIYEYVKKGVMR